MSETLLVDLFGEDRGHEALLVPLVERIARELGRDIHVRVRSAHGGRGKEIAEFERYQRAMGAGLGGDPPGILVVAIDANCKASAERRDEIIGAVDIEFRDRLVPACPDPHIERWYLADVQAFHEVVGVTPSVPRGKCERGFYKRILADAVREAGHPPMLGGIEFAGDLARAMHLFRAGRADSSLKHFLDRLTECLKLI
jgi:hypothetical protein